MERRDSREAAGAAKKNGAEPVTQTRLEQGLRLHLDEIRIAQELRQFRLQLEADLAAGSPTEGGDLLYDSQLKIVRRNITDATVSR